MPAPFVPRRVEEYIFYYYAKLVIAPSAGFRSNYRFIVDTYKRLRAGEIHMSDYERELLHLAQMPNTCSFCGKENVKVVPQEVIPRSLGGPIGLHNLANACLSCARSKGDRDLVQWWCDELGKSYDSLPRVPLGLYLKTCHELHMISFTLKERCDHIADIFLTLRKRIV
jgi:hypothetical protein